MNHTLFSIICAAIVALTPSQTPGQDPTKDSSPYYPLKVGTQWQYQIGTVQVTMRVAKLEKVGDEMCGVVESSVEGKVVATEHISSKADGIFRHTFNGMKASEPLCILKLPEKNGEEWQKWKFDAKIANETVKGAFICGQDEITVPAGKFKTVTAFTTECDLNGNKAEFKYWFASGVGIVKQSINIGGREIVSELKEFKAAP